MKPLSSDSERALIGALGEVASLVSSGDLPNDAIAKIASERRIPRGHVHLMVNAYNTGRTEAQRKSSTDVLEKAGEFTLADSDAVLGQMFPEQVKTAAERQRDTVVDASYSRPPTLRQTRERLDRLSLVKEADFKFCAKPAPLAPESGLLAKRALQELAQSRRRLEERRAEVQNLFDRVFAKTSALSHQLRLVGAPNFHEVKENATLLFGEKAGQLFGHLATAHPAFGKQAAADPARVSRADSGSGIYREIQDVLTLADEYQKARGEHQKLAQDTSRREVEIVAPFSSAPPMRGVLDPSSNKEAAFFGGFLGTGMGALSGRVAAEQFTPLSTATLQGKVQNKLTDPQHETSLRNIQTQSMLNDLMANDDVIAGSDPNEVISHFNEISQLAPRAAGQSGLVRALLRKRLQQGALDPYEVDLLLKIENGLRGRDSGAPQGVLGDGSSVLG